MEQGHFDALTRALAQLIDRRQGVGLTLAAVLATLLAERDAAAKKGKKKKRRKDKRKKKKRRKRSGGLRNCNSIALVEGADLHECDLREHPDLATADFTNARLEDSDLSNAQLSGVSFRGAWMWRANLQNANLTGADFSNSGDRKTDIFEVDFSGADLTDARNIDDPEHVLYHHYAIF